MLYRLYRREVVSRARRLNSAIVFISYAFYHLRSYFCQQRLRYSEYDSFSGYFVFVVGVGRGSRGVCGEDVAPSHLRDRSQKAGVGQMILLD